MDNLSLMWGAAYNEVTRGEDGAYYYSGSDLNGSRIRLSGADVAHITSNYDSRLRRADALLGELLGFLRKEGLMENTVIAFTAEHGTVVGEEDAYMFRNNWLWRENFAVPLILSIPGGRNARVGGGKFSTIELKDSLLSIVGLPYYAAARVEQMGREVAGLLSRSGCANLDIGIESGNERLRRNVLKRNYTNATVVRAFGNAAKAGLRTSSENIIGIPYETPENVIETIKLNAKVSPFKSSVNILYPFKGTELATSATGTGGWTRGRGRGRSSRT